jgi:predicted HAD superfamily Cof-like phosphohydrolase
MIEDNKVFQKKFGFDEKPLTKEQLRFRMELLREEFEETWTAFLNKDSEEWVDGHIDLLVIALGNLHLAGVDTEKAWKEVYRANMSKVRGVKPGRENSGGFDVMKPEGWKGPDHSGNHGKLDDVFKKD